MFSYWTPTLPGEIHCKFFELLHFGVLNRNSVPEPVLCSPHQPSHNQPLQRVWEEWASSHCQRRRDVLLPAKNDPWQQSSLHQLFNQDWSHQCAAICKVFDNFRHARKRNCNGCNASLVRNQQRVCCKDVFVRINARFRLRSFILKSFDGRIWGH